MNKIVFSFYMMLLASLVWATPEEDFLSDLRASRLRDARFFLDGHSPDVELEDGMQALVLMVRENRNREVRWLVEQGADPNLPDREGWTALMHAARQGNRTTARILLKAGAEINARLSDGTTALLIAVNHGRGELAAYLEEQGAWILGGYYDQPQLDEIWSRRQRYRRALSLFETRWKHHGFLEILVNGSYRELKAALDDGGDPDAADTEGVTALMMAAAGEDAFKGRLLLERGADPGLRDAEGLTALWYASYENNLTLLEELLKVDRSGLNEAAYLEISPLFGAFCSSSHDAMNSLLEAGIRADLKGRLGCSLVHYAALGADLRSLRILKDAGVALGDEDDKGLTAMDYLIKGYHLGEDEALYLPVASFLKDEGVSAVSDASVLDNVKLSRIIYSKW